ncbi:uncharacterized protein LOC130799814 isoform X2 [Amaranthus tricolor]|uniref:uncharacterized protein LOC130799814 isoform X2 n=1 Tax=Amaranthus tricolor TaxID=29722 RepID=UPI0025860C22|nr:uncharacterized protein LOC130799814 isoform X2 [Amaranthus tricolor]
MFGNPIFETGKTPFLSFCSFTLLLHILHIRVFLSADRREIAILVSNQPLNSTINVPAGTWLDSIQDNKITNECWWFVWWD